MQKFSEWNKIDLHIHSKESNKVKINDYDGEEYTATQLLDILTNDDNNINIFSITDHNCINKDLYCEIDEKISEESYKNKINYVVGVELDINDSYVFNDVFHCLCFFDTKDINVVSKAVDEIFDNMELKDRNTKDIYPDVNKIFRSLANNNIQNILLIPHFNNKNKGLPSNIAIEHLNYLCFNAYEDSNNIKNIQKSLNIYKEAGYDNFPFAVFTDNHNLNIYPKDKNNNDNEIKCWILGNMLEPFNAIKTAFQEAKMRISLSTINGMRNISYPNKFINTINIGGKDYFLSPYQNTIVGKFGSGKSLLLHKIKYGSENLKTDDKNIEFLEIFKKYEGKLVTPEVKIDIYKDAIQSGALTPENMSSHIKAKIKRGELLTDEEMKDVMEHNEPSNGFTGRVGDYIMSLENQAFIQRLGTQRKYRIRLTELGNKLIDGIHNEQDLYTKAMIGLEYGSTSRVTVDNRANPFLNTIFVINELRNKYAEKAQEFKGITLYEFGLFVLTMKNCKYKKAVEDILKYREDYGITESEAFANDYLSSNDIQPYAKETIYGSASYSDEVLRKFKKTGLIAERRVYQTRYINFNEQEIEKIFLLLEKYENYSWKSYSSDDDYYEYIETIVLPWEESSSNYYKVLKRKAEAIDYNLNEDDITENDYEEINKLYYQFVFESNDYDQFPYDNIINELQLIDRTIDGDSSLSDVEEYVRFEWFTSLLLANKFGKENVKAHLILDDEGLPLSQAPGNNPDVELISENLHYNIEVTTIKNRNQQLNAETTTVARHLAVANNGEVINKALLIAPFIHEDTIRYYRFEANDSGVTIVPMTLSMFLKVVEKSMDIAQFDAFIEECSDKLKNGTIVEYEQFISDYE